MGLVGSSMEMSTPMEAPFFVTTLSSARTSSSVRCPPFTEKMMGCGFSFGSGLRK